MHVEKTGSDAVNGFDDIGAGANGVPNVDTTADARGQALDVLEDVGG
jgi:hypothetical protein